MNLLPKSRTILPTAEEDSNSPAPTVGSDRIAPTDFVAFLPWACTQFDIDVYLEICRIEQTKYVSRAENIQVRSKSKNVKSIISESAKGMTSDYTDTDVYMDENRLVRLTAKYSDDQLVQIKIDRTKHLPREVLAIIQLVIRFYPHLTTFSINSGADKYTVHELCKILPSSNITEINFDNTVIEEANYDMVLVHSKQLKVLSLCRCKINDQVVERIASKLEYPSNVSMTLSVLNLSSNQVTDIGAKLLSKMLRTNRQLSYLNLANNMITDDGVQALFYVLNKFCLTMEEKLIVRGNYLKHLKKKQMLIDDYMKNFRAAEMELRKKKRNIMIPKKSSSTLLKKSSSESLRHRSLSGAAVAYEKAVKMANITCGEFNDPFAKDTFSENCFLCSKGNNTLAYLNIAYNGISQRSVKTLVNVLKYQRSQLRTPRGLIMVQLEGNPLPGDTPELLEIDTILKGGLTKEYLNGSATASKKKLLSQITNSREFRSQT